MKKPHHSNTRLSHEVYIQRLSDAIRDAGHPEERSALALSLKEITANNCQIFDP